MGSRVKAWVRVTAGASTGVESEDAIGVRTEATENADTGTIVYAADGLGRKLSTATVDGVVNESQAVKAVEYDLITPLVDQIIDQSKLALSVLMCYGDESSGRSEGLFGSDNLLACAVDKILAHPNSPANHGLQVSSTLVTMELLQDLLNPKSELTINETQFSGLHIDGGEWRPVTAPGQIGALASTITSERDRIMSEQGAGLSARCVTIVALRFAPAAGDAYGNTLYMVDLASPPIAKASGVPGLALDDYCSINTSLKTLTKCLTAMGSKKKAATPPLRDSRLTHLLGLALGDDSALIHCLVYVPGRRSKRAEAVAAIQWAGKATAARLKKGVYASASSKALVSQLQGVVASLEEPNEQMAAEMREQMQPSKSAVAELTAAVEGKRSMLREVEDEVTAQKRKVEEQLGKNREAAEARKKEQDEIRTAIEDLKEQVEGVRTGKKLKEAMDTLKKTIEEEKVALRKQLSEMEGRLSEAKGKLSGLSTANEKVANGAPAMCNDLVQKGHAYTKAGKFKYASLMFMSAVKLMESIGLGRSGYVVPPVSALADLYSAEGMDEEAIALYKQAYSIEKDASGADSPALARHLQKLGAAYEKQGKMEAATLTLEEAGSVLEHAHGPDHPEVQALREQLAALIEPEPEPEPEEEEEEEAVEEAPAEVPEPEPVSDPMSARFGAQMEAATAPVALKKVKKKKDGEKEEAATGKDGKKKPAPKKGSKKGDKASKDGKDADGGEAEVKKAPAPKLSRTGNDDEATVQKFSSQRMRARLEARQRRLAEEGRELSLGSAPTLPAPPDEDGEAFAMSDVLMKKREMFRERMAHRKANEEAKDAISNTRDERTGEKERHSDEEEEDSDNEEESDVEEDVGGEDEDGFSEVAMIESQVIEIIAQAHGAAQREDWAEVLDCSSQLEDKLARAKGKVAACATAARVLLNTGLKHASGFSDEPRVRSTLGCLMLIEWCVPTCPDAFRQAIASDRWVRKLVDLCRKDSTDQALVRTTVVQLMSNWSSWYANQLSCAGFEKGCDMLENEGFEIPAAAPRDAAEPAGGYAPPGTERAMTNGLGVPGLQLQLQLPLSSTQPSYLGSADGGSSKIQAELDIMREDVRTLEAALQKMAHAKLGSLELIDAGQAATDTRGWQSRLKQLLGASSPGNDAPSTHRADLFSDAVLDEMRTLLAQVDGLLQQWAEAAPLDNRARNRRAGSSEKNVGDKEDKSEQQSAAQVMATGRIGDVVLPTLTPRGSGAAGGAGGATPRNPQLFLHNPKLLTARGPLAVPAEIANQLSARGGMSNRGGASNRSQRGFPPLQMGKGVQGRPSPLGGGGQTSFRAFQSGQDSHRDGTERKKVPGLPIPAPEPMPHLDLAVPSSRRNPNGTDRGGQSQRGPGNYGDGSANAGDIFDDLLAPDRHSLSYLDLALPGQFGSDGVPDFFAQGFMDDSQMGGFMGDPAQALDVQLAELSGLLGGDANAPQFLQEMLMLQMQAEAWRMQWSVAMQENEELRAKLYDTRNSLEAAGGGGASGEHWRELCISIAKSAEDEKGQILEQISGMRDELTKTSGTVDVRKEDLDKLAAQAEADRKSAEEWSAKANEVIKLRNELNAKLYTADAAAAETEADVENAALTAEEQKSKTIALEAEAEQLAEKLREEELLYESTLTEVYNAHREQVDGLNIELTANEEDLQQGSAAMNQWRTQWEEELTEKNSIDAELLTLRSEFEKSSSTYDREIEGLKELLQKESVLREDMQKALQAEEQELSEHQAALDKLKAELQDISQESTTESAQSGDMQKEIDDAAKEIDKFSAEYQEAHSRQMKADSESEALKQSMSGEQSSLAEKLQALRDELASVTAESDKHAETVQRLADTEKKIGETKSEAASLREQINATSETAASEQGALQEALSDARSAAAKWEQEHTLQLAAKSTLLEEVNSLKLEAKELTDAHAREVERLNERLGQLERVHDTLDVTLAEEEAAFEANLKVRREAFEAKIAQQESAVADLVAQQEDVRAQLSEVRTLLTQEQRERQQAEEAMRDVREMAEAKTADAEERERRLGAALSDMQSERARIEKEAADEKARFEQLLSTMGGEQEETNRKQKEAEERAVEFEKQWVSESKLRKELHNQLEEMVGNLRVYCRVRPASKAEREGQLSVEVKGSDKVIVTDHESGRKDDAKHYNFTQVYGMTSTQEEVFKDTESLMTSVLDGFNVCIFAYGQSGTGKTFTMEGNEEHPGLVPRAIMRIFEDVQSRTTNYQHDIFISMIEIYNENIRDLLRDPKADTSKIKYDIMRDPLVGMYVKDLTSEQIHTASHARTLIKGGNTNRAVASTGLNDQSSRSHMIVTLTVRTKNLKSGDNYVGKLSLVDLAGSERLAKSQTTGQAQKETMAINKSLSALGTVIASLATSEKHVPYRDSKVTYLLQDSLGGNSKTLMFVNCGPAQGNCAETVNSLNFASRAKSVALGKATKNREDETGGGGKSGKASTVMAAANKLGNDADGGDVKASARGEGGEKKKLGAKKR